MSTTDTAETFVIVRFLVSANRYSTATFDNGAIAYDFIRAAITAGAIICTSTVTGPGTDAFDQRGREYWASLHTATQNKL